MTYVIEEDAHNPDGTDPGGLDSGPMPGETCDRCKRRVPHPKKPTSPKTKVWAVRIPVDEVDAFDELVEAASKHLGSQGRPHDKFWTLQLAIVFMLQAQESAGALSRLSTFGTKLARGL